MLTFLTWCRFQRISLLDTIIKCVFRAGHSFLILIILEYCPRDIYYVIKKTPNTKNATGYFDTA